MKLSFVQITLAMIFSGLAIAHDNNAQEILNRKVSLQLNEVTLMEALGKIEEITKVKFVYSPARLDLDDKVSVEASKKKLGELLKDLLAPRDIQFRVQEGDDYIVLIEQKTKEESSNVNLDAEANNPALASVSGKVTDEEGNPMPGVNVILKGTTIGTSTDSEGRYVIDADNDGILVFTFIGFVTQEVAAGGRTVIDITMVQDVSTLEEVVVNAGYYHVKDRQQTGNIVKVDAKDIQKQPVSNPIAALQGRVSGLEVTQLTGVPGGNFTVRIRGTNSLKNGNDPLYIIDGVPFTSTAMSFNETSGGIYGQNDNIRYGGSSPLNSINPNDIESIEILKDADATAIYGSRGSNGVILITTKKGKIGKTQVDVNLYTGAARVASKMDLLKTNQYLEMRREAYANDNLSPTLGNGPDLLVWDTTSYTDWQRELIGGTANTTDGQISILGGDKDTQFSIGAGYHKETTVFPGNNKNRRISTNISIVNTSPNNRLKTSLSINYSSGLTDLLSQDLTSKALTLPPNAPALYDENGEISWLNWNYNFPNPLSYLQQKYEARTDNLIGNVVISYAILHNLEIKTSFGYSNTRMKAVTVTPASSLDPAIAPFSTNLTAFSNSDFQNWVVEPQLSWKPKLGSGEFAILIGTQFLDQRSEGLAQYASGFTNEALMKDIGSASNTDLSTSKYSQYRYHAVFGRVNYALREKYFFNITGRRDGSSRFGPGKQFANFGAIGAAWIFSAEPFLRQIQLLSFGKIRASYGLTGNDQLGDYQYLDTYRSSGNYQENIGLAPVRLSNPDFAWETNKKLEIALDLGFIKDRILASVSFYRNRSSNQLVGFPLPPTTGFSSVQGNFPAIVENKGFEIELNTINVQHSVFNWSTFINLTIPRNELVDFPDLATSEFADTYVVGEPMQIRKVYNSTGIDQTTGLYQFEDINGDGAYNQIDRNIVKFIGQDFYGGIQNSFNYNGFQLDFLFQFVKQIGTNYITVFGAPGIRANQPEFVMNRWQSENANSDRQRFTRGGIGSTTYSRFRSSEAAVGDASFIRLKNISLSYLLPKKWTERIHAEKVRVFIQGQNILTITDYKGLDPETQSGNYLPPLKVITAGVSFTF